MTYRATLQHVSCPPSEIPYVGFSPVRLQTGCQLRPSAPVRQLKHEACIRRTTAALYAATAALSPGSTLLPPVSAQHGLGSADPVAGLSPKRGSLLQARRSSPEALGSPTGSAVPSDPRLLWPHPRLSPPPPGLSASSWGVFARQPRLGWKRELPQFAPPVFPFVPPSVPRQTQRVLLAVATPLIVAFATSVQARHLQLTHAGSHVSSVTRLQGSLHAAARRFARPTPARAFTPELSSFRVTSERRRVSLRG